MSLQLLTQIYAPADNAVIKRTDQMDETKNLYAQYSKGGLLLFLKIDDIINTQSQFVYFMVYSMSPKITVYWGVFDKINNDFIFDSGCVGNLKKLNDMLNKWKEHGYQYTANVVQDQIKPLLNKYRGITKQKGKISFDYPLYSIFMRVVNGIENGHSVDRDDLIKFKIAIFDTFIKDPEFSYASNDIDHIVRLYESQIDRIYDLKKDDINQQMRDYEATINRIDINNDLRQQMIELRRITTLFFDKIKHGEYFYHNRVTDICPDIDECQVKNKVSCGAYEYGYNILYVEDIL